MFDAEFTDAPGEVGAEVTDEVLHRTPGFTGWQQERWLHHCNDAAEFHGPAGAEELAPFPDAVECLRLEVLEWGGWSAEQVDGYLQSLSKDGQPTAYLFRCRHCETHLAYSDFA
jgi:uncharacterized protein